FVEAEAAPPALQLCQVPALMCPSSELHTVAVGQTAATAVAVDDSCVYWIAAAGGAPGVYRAGRDGADARRLAEVAPLVHPSWALHIHGQDLYYTEPGTIRLQFSGMPKAGTPGQIRSLPRAGGNPATVATGNGLLSGQPTRLAADAVHLYWTENTG